MQTTLIPSLTYFTCVGWDRHIPLSYGPSPPPRVKYERDSINGCWHLSMYHRHMATVKREDLVYVTD